MVAPSGRSGVQRTAKAGHSWGLSTPRRIRPLWHSDAVSPADVAAQDDHLDRQRQGQRQRHVGLADPEVGGDELDDEGQQEEIEGVERPAQEAGNDSVHVRALEPGGWAGLSFRRRHENLRFAKSL